MHKYGDCRERSFINPTDKVPQSEIKKNVFS